MCSVISQMHEFNHGIFIHNVRSGEDTAVMDFNAAAFQGCLPSVPLSTHLLGRAPWDQPVRMVFTTFVWPPLYFVKGLSRVTTGWFSFLHPDAWQTSQPWFSGWLHRHASPKLHNPPYAAGHLARLHLCRSVSFWACVSVAPRTRASAWGALDACGAPPSSEPAVSVAFFAFLFCRRR